MPDHSYYQFGYELTNGTGPNVTGRIASVRLPIGGMINYSYNNSSCTNPHNCIMADGSPSYVQRALGNGTWNYQRKIDPSDSLLTQTTVLDPASPSNETDLTFSGIYEEQRYTYQNHGSSKVLLQETHSCYNNYTDCPTQHVTPPIRYKAFFNDFDRHDTTIYGAYDQWFNANGLMTEEKDSDVTTGHPAIRIVNVVYDLNLCNTYNICDRPDSAQIEDGGGASKSYTLYAYDQGQQTHGKVTTVKRSTTGATTGPFLQQGYTYNSNGTLSTATDPNGSITNYGGYTCSSAFPTRVTVGGLTTIYTYDCNGGLVTSVKDPNNQTATISYTLPNGDPYYWRPASSTDRSGSVTYYNYYDVSNSWAVNTPSHVTVPGQSESVMAWISNGGCCDNTVKDLLSTPDAYGRPFLLQKRQSWFSSTWDTTQLVFDSSGRVQQGSLPFSAGPGPHQIYSGLSYTRYEYDNLGRYTNISKCSSADCNGPATFFYYLKNDVGTDTWSGNQQGQKFSKVREYDALGRLTSVCEMTSASDGGPCGQNTPETGYRTAYTYDPLGDLIGATQGSQGRSYTYDGLGRMMQENNPESGITNYTYDTQSQCLRLSSKGDLVQIDAGGNERCYYYDSLHRLTDVGNNHQGPNNPCLRFRYDNSNGYTGSRPAGVNPTNTMGRVIEAATDECDAHDPILADEWFSYSPRGEAIDTWQSTPHSGGYYHVHQDYYANGAIASLQGFVTNAQGHDTAFSHSFGFGEDGEGRPAGYWDVTLNNLDVSNAVYNEASQPTHVGLDYGGEDFTYEPYEDRMATWRSYTGPNNDLWNSGTLYWNPISEPGNGTLWGLDLRDSANPSSDETCTYTYDDLARLSGVNCGSVWQQSFTFDRWGNIAKLGPSGVNFNSQGGSGNHVPGFSYDASGNVTFDGAHHYSYDVYGHPITVDGITTTFDALGRAVEKNGTEQIVYSPSGEKFAYMNGSSLGQYMVPIVAGMLAVYLPDPTGLHHFRHVDWLGSVRFDSTPSGTVWYDGAYAPFGENYEEIGTHARSFTGQTQDTLTDTYDFPARQENENQSRWLASDPAGLSAVDITDPQTWNRYAYVANRPLTNVDPLGLKDDDGDGDCDDYECGGFLGDGGGGGPSGGGDTGGGDNGDGSTTISLNPDNNPGAIDIPLPDNPGDDAPDGGTPLYPPAPTDDSTDYQQFVFSVDALCSSVSGHCGAPYENTQSASARAATQAIAQAFNQFPTLCTPGVGATAKVGTWGVNYNYDFGEGGEITPSIEPGNVAIEPSGDVSINVGNGVGGTLTGNPLKHIIKSVGIFLGIEHKGVELNVNAHASVTSIGDCPP